MHAPADADVQDAKVEAVTAATSHVTSPLSQEETAGSMFRKGGVVLYLAA